MKQIKNTSLLVQKEDLIIHFYRKYKADLSVHPSTATQSTVGKRERSCDTRQFCFFLLQECWIDLLDMTTLLSDSLIRLNSLDKQNTQISNPENAAWFSVMRKNPGKRFLPRISHFDVYPHLKRKRNQWNQTLHSQTHPHFAFLIQKCFRGITPSWFMSVNFKQISAPFWNSTGGKHSFSWSQGGFSSLIP